MPSVRLLSNSLNFKVTLDFGPIGRFYLDGYLRSDGNLLILAQFIDQNLHIVPFQIGEGQVAGQVINIHEYIDPAGDDNKYRSFLAELPSECELKDLSFLISY